MKLSSAYYLSDLQGSNSNISFSEYIRDSLAKAVEPVPDGRIHRFDIDKKGDNAGWYIMRELSDGFFWGQCASWKSSDIFTWTSKKSITEKDKALISKAMKDYEEEKKKAQKEAEKLANELYANLPSAPADFGYFTKKGIKDYGIARYDSGNGYIILPCYTFDEEGNCNLTSVQKIWPDGKKMFLSGASMKGAFLIIGEEDVNMYICEGFATGCSIHEATGKSVVVAFNCGNLKNVAKYMTANGLMLTGVADNDKNDAGKKGMEEAEIPYVMIPMEGMDANDYAQNGYDLKELLEPTVEEKWLEPISERRKSRTTTSWLIKKWIPEKGLTMIFGAPGSGKSFLIFDMLSTITTGKGEWFGYKAKEGCAIYLCGEGHAGLDDRIEAWAQEKHISDFGQMYISRNAVDLDNRLELQKAIENIAGTDQKISIIAIDTLNRFFSGDENSAQEARNFIASCSALQERFDCAVVIIHHTGVAAESQSRARGSSAFLGACDTAILVQNLKSAITLTQVKQKYIEPLSPMYLRLEGVDIKDWFDEDGEQIRSAVLVEGEEVKEENKLPIDKMILVSEAWQSGQKLYQNGLPFITKADMYDYLSDKGWNVERIKVALRKDRESRLMQSLVIAGLLADVEEGWKVIDPVYASSMMLCANG